MASQSLPSVLPVMRQLLRLVRTLPDHQREAALFEMRDKVRARAGEADAAKVLEHRKELYSKLGYLRIIAPRAPANAPSGTSESTGSTTYVYRDGKFVEGRGETAGSRSVLCGCIHNLRAWHHQGWMLQSRLSSAHAL